MSFPGTPVKAGLVALAAMALTACSDSSLSQLTSPTAPAGARADAVATLPQGLGAPTESYGFRSGPALSDPADLAALMTEAIDEEYLALATYQRANLDLANPLPFSNIVLSEANHVDAIAGMFTRRSWAVPPSPFDPATLPVFASLSAACAAGVNVEIADIALYDRLLTRTDLPRDVQNVFTNLREASRSHLAAFQLCR